MFILFFVKPRSKCKYENVFVFVVKCLIHDWIVYINNTIITIFKNIFSLRIILFSRINILKYLKFWEIVICYIRFQTMLVLLSFFFFVLYHWHVWFSAGTYIYVKHVMNQSMNHWIRYIIIILQVITIILTFNSIHVILFIIIIKKCV